jgi:competence protein ComEC
VSRFAVAGLAGEAASASNTDIVEVGRGDRFHVGSVRVEVLSPHRRFASENDGSIVLLLTADVTLLLPGDIESVGQRELPAVQPDVIVVPHHGSATTDLRWLTSTVGEMAVLSYGPNTYGHPHPDVLAVLGGTGVDVRSTATEGDVSIPLTPTNR